MLLVLKPKIGSGQIFDPDTNDFTIFYITTNTFYAYTVGVGSIFNLTTDTIIGDSIELRTISLGTNKPKFNNYDYINLEQLPRGIYFCSVTTTNGDTFTKQVIIQ